MKKILVTQTSMPPYEEFCEEIKSMWNTKYITNSGPKHQELEQKICEYLQVENTSLFTNGHLALYTALKILKMKGEVITTPFTFASTINAIVENGLTPVFCDINPHDYTIDSSKIENLITDKTCAILAVHVYGNACDVENIEKIANKYNLKVIYDAAHVFGVKYKNRSICEYGDISMLSFHATKVFNTIEGGALIYKDNKKYSRLKALKNFGIDDDGYIIEESINAKMNEFQASMGLCNLRHFREELSKRERVFNKYKELLKNVNGIKLNELQENVTPNYAYFPILVDKHKYGKTAENLFNILKENNIYSRRYFYPLVSDYEYYNNLGYESSNTPIAKKISENILCLPMYADLDLQDVVNICQIIKNNQS